jgi:hypothetical protein
MFVFVDLVRQGIRHLIEPLATYLEKSAVDGGRIEFSSGSRRQILFALRPAVTFRSTTPGFLAQACGLR